jgi:hypothetical protein
VAFIDPTARRAPRESHDRHEVVNIISNYT